MTEPKPRVLVLTGAGASKPLGLPTMEGLLPDVFAAQLQGEERDVFDMAANWAAGQNPTVLDFELIFTLVDLVAHLEESDPAALAFAAPRTSAGGFLFTQGAGSYSTGNLPADRAAAARLLERLKRVVHEQLAPPDAALAVQLYHGLFEILAGLFDPQGVIELFTTNYDRAVEISHETAADVDFELVKGFAQVGRGRGPRW